MFILSSTCWNNISSIYRVWKSQAVLGLVKQWLSTNFNININLDAKELLFSGQNKNFLLSYISRVSKHYIYTNKFTERELNISNYISLLKKKFQSERYIAYVLNNISKFFIKWLPLSIVLQMITVNIPWRYKSDYLFIPISLSYITNICLSIKERKIKFILDHFFPLPLTTGISYLCQ